MSVYLLNTKSTNEKYQFAIYINNNLTEEEIKKNMPCKIVQNNLDINLTKEIEDFYKENFKILKKENKKNIR